MFCQLFIGLAHGCVFDKFLVPGIHTVQGSVSAPGECPHDIHGSGSQEISLLQSLWIGPTGLCIRLRAVYHVTPVTGNFNSVDNFSIRRARLGILSGHSTYLDNRFAACIGKDDGHLQNYFKGFPDARRSAMLKVFRTVPALQQKSLTGSSLGQLIFQPPDLAGKYQRRQLGYGC